MASVPVVDVRPGLDLPDVDAGRVFLEELLALDLVELGRLLQEVRLEVLLVYIPETAVDEQVAG